MANSHIAVPPAGKEGSDQKAVQEAVEAAEAAGVPTNLASKHDLNMLCDSRPHQARLQIAACNMSIPFFAALLTNVWVPTRRPYGSDTNWAGALLGTGMLLATAHITAVRRKLSAGSSQLRADV